MKKGRWSAANTIPDMKSEDEKDQDFVAWANAETLAFTKRKAKLWGTVALTNLVAFALMLKGMPAHALAPFLGTPVGISLMFVSAVAGYYGLRHLDERVRLRHRQK